MSESESTDNRIERIIRKWETLYISLLKIDGRVQSPRQFYHLWRQINADRARAATCGFGCESAWPCGDVQQMRAGVQTHGVEQVVCGQRGHSRKKCLIARCQSIMTLTLEST
jgi:hypothetical protein